MNELCLAGPLIGLATFCIICLCHPIVIETEYYSATRPSWVVLLLGVTGFSSLWTILELFEQRTRVKKGWFPKGPGHRD